MFQVTDSAYRLADSQGRGDGRLYFLMEMWQFLAPEMMMAWSMAGWLAAGWRSGWGCGARFIYCPYFRIARVTGGAGGRVNMAMAMVLHTCTLYSFLLQRSVTVVWRGLAV